MNSYLSKLFPNASKDFLKLHGLDGKSKMPPSITLPDKTILFTNGSKITAHVNGPDKIMGFDALKGIKDAALIKASMSIPISPSKPAQSPQKGRLDTFQKLCVSRLTCPPPTKEHRFDRKRRWRFDYAWAEQKVALEVEGGVWIQGRHTRGAGFVKDMEKYSRAASLGWLVLRVQPKTLATDTTVNLVLTALNAHSFTAFWRTELK